MTTFSQRLRDALEKQRFSNRKIAEEIGVSPTSIANILSGDNKPNVETVTKLVGALKINGHWLLTGEGDMWQSPAGLGMVQAAVAVGGNNHQVMAPSGADPCAELRVALEASQQENSRLKDKIILLLEGQQKA